MFKRILSVFLIICALFLCTGCIDEVMSVWNGEILEKPVEADNAVPDNSTPPPVETVEPSETPTGATYENVVNITPERTPPPVVEVCFTQKEANRAAITAMTNYFASDVFTDGSYDSSRFHSYSDTSGSIENYLIYDLQSGMWLPKSENTWHVNFLELSFASGQYKVVNLDVSYDGSSYYTISNAEDVSEGSSPCDFSDSWLCFSVPAFRIEEDRVFS